jgi:hypothetical protein
MSITAPLRLLVNRDLVHAMADPHLASRDGHPTRETSIDGWRTRLSGILPQPWRV